MRRKQAGWLVTALLLAGLTGGCQAYRTSARSDPTTDFAAYRTYAWMPHVDSIASRRDSAGYDDDIVEARIHAAVGQALEARGFRLDANGPDILLQYHVGSRDVERVVAEPMSTYYPAPYWSPGYMRAYPRYYYYQMPYVVSNGLRVEQVTNGRLLVDIIDRRTRRLVWRGISTGELPKPSVFDGEIPDIVRGMFKKYPQ